MIWFSSCTYNSHQLLSSQHSDEQTLLVILHSGSVTKLDVTHSHTVNIIMHVHMHAFQCLGTNDAQFLSNNC